MKTNIKMMMRGVGSRVVVGMAGARDYAVFMVLLLLYSIRVILRKTVRVERLIKGLDRVIKLIDRGKAGGVDKGYLIELAFKNMGAKKTRSIVTVGGVALGVGAIVFLVSLGYGLERMVISRVARLEELKMIDVGIGEASNLKMNDEVVAKISQMDGVKEVIPVVSMVSKVKFKNSILDIMTMGVDERYMKVIGVKMVAGDQFVDKDNDFSYDQTIKTSWVDELGSVAGIGREEVIAAKGDRVEVGVMRFNIGEGKRLPVWKECDTDGQFYGYVIRQEGGYVGEEIWGERYYTEAGTEKVAVDMGSGEVEYSPWIRAKIALWQVDEASSGVVPILDKDSRQKWEIGCVMANNVLVDEGSREELGVNDLDEWLYGSKGKVLGETTVTASSSVSSGLATASATTAVKSADLFEVVVATDSAGVEWVELKGAGDDPNKVKEVSFYGSPVAEAYVSRGMLKVLGVEPEMAKGQKFGVSYIVSDTLIGGMTGRLQSNEVEYQVAGVVDDEASNYYYFQIADAKRLGVKNYSQLKIVTADQNKVAEIRRAVETLGLRTTSTLDTVAEIEKLFKTLRMVLGLLGTIALAVAGLGMFNTMTVSLLERTREVGAMKAMGMLSSEVKELFLAESMIMGVGGGVVGVLLGWGGGVLLSVVLSSVSMIKGQSYINISYVPFFFVAFIILVSFFVGIITGWYPSKRAKQISALNALRYE